MTTLNVELITPERVVLSQEADSVTLPTQTGEITVLPGHMPLIAGLASGMMTIRKGGVESLIAITGGFLEILAGGKVRLLADSADRAEELDLEAVEAAREKAQLALTEKRHVDDVSSAAAVAALERELARVKVARHHRSRNLPR